MSNWEAAALSWPQVAYAALDALVCGHILRSLRRWHSSPSACDGCQKQIGAHPDYSELGCSCGKLFKIWQDLKNHMEYTGHASSFFGCSSCGRVVRSVDAATRDAAAELPSGPDGVREAGAVVQQLQEERAGAWEEEEEEGVAGPDTPPVEISKWFMSEERRKLYQLVKHKVGKGEQREGGPGKRRRSIKARQEHVTFSEGACRQIAFGSGAG
jgi:hypothetical protein